jgi:hypothetical protein
MTLAFDRELLGCLIDLYQARVLDARGHVCKCHYVRQGGRRVLPPLGGMLAGSAAHLALTPFESNPFYGSHELFQLALDAGERLVMDCADVTPDTKPNHFDIYPLTRLYQLMGAHAGKTRLACWRDTMARNLRSIDALIDRVGDSLGKPGPWSGTGPNHFFGWFAVGYGQAALLGEDRLARKIEKAMLRHLALQAPAGYFPEHIGPCTGYQHVSLGGVAEFHRQDPLPQTHQAVRRGVNFTVHAIYPNLRGIETFDERNRFGHEPRFQHALLWTPQGRALFARLLAIARNQLRERRSSCRPLTKAIPFTRSDWYGIGAAFRCYDHALATRGIPVAGQLPIDRKTFTWRLESKGLVRKQGPWFYVLSAWAHPTLPGNPYHLERTQALSIYHDRTGLIIGGGNDKRAYHAATIHVLEGGECHYFPPIHGKILVSAAPKVLAGNGACDGVLFDYGSARARLEVRAESPGRLRIALGASTTQTEPRVWLVLQLPVDPPLAMNNAGATLSLNKATEGQSAAQYSLGRAIASPAGWRMSLPPQSALIWPHFPWNPYRPPAYRETPDRAVVLLRVPLHGPGMRVQLVLDVAARR